MQKQSVIMGMSNLAILDNYFLLIEKLLKEDNTGIPLELDTQVSLNIFFFYFSENHIILNLITG